MKIVYNAEPLGYSEKAKRSWKDKGYLYRDGSWEEIEETPLFQAVIILIVRLQRKVDLSVLNRFPNLKIVVSATTGHDHLDIAAIEKKGIKTTSLRGQDKFLKTIPSTAEHTWALLLSLIRNIPAANQHVKEGKWNRDSFKGIQLKGKVMGIVGYGRTGRKVASYARAFDMKVKYFDPYVDIDEEEKEDSLINLLNGADIISIHVHLSNETEHLLNQTNLAYLREGSYLINTSRGKLWDEEAISILIEAGKICGVATDVLSSELIQINNSPLKIAQDKGHNIIITPHIGGCTSDAMWACEEFITTLVD